MGANDLLILRAADLDARLTALGDKLVSDRSFRELYVNDPARVILKSVFPDQSVPAAEVNRGNRLLYALLSNERFTTWAQQYSTELVQKANEVTRESNPEKALREYLAVTDRENIHREVAMAVAEFADPELIAALTWRPDPESIGVTRVADVAVDIEVLIYAVAVAAVFAVAVAAVFAAAAVAESEVGVSRIDVQRVVAQLTERLAERGQELRDSGALVDFSRRNSGYIR
ncbi:hypothetical protein ACH4NT_36720 [Streptomyces lydicus]|uniref:hypothetical protein n=1 Tax=Streptomyces lydicus TaxID=47763 RepID=UPI003788ADA6